MRMHRRKGRNSPLHAVYGMLRRPRAQRWQGKHNVCAVEESMILPYLVWQNRKEM